MTDEEKHKAYLQAKELIEEHGAKAIGIATTRASEFNIQHKTREAEFWHEVAEEIVRQLRERGDIK